MWCSYHIRAIISTGQNGLQTSGKELPAGFYKSVSPAAAHRIFQGTKEAPCAWQGIAVLLTMPSITNTLRNRHGNESRKKALITPKEHQYPKVLPQCISHPDSKRFLSPSPACLHSAGRSSPSPWHWGATQVPDASDSQLLISTYCLLSMAKHRKRQNKETTANYI